MARITTRLPEWERRFSDWLESRRNMPFEWGSNDCLQFGLSGIFAVTGQDVLPERTIYHNAEQAAEWLRLDGYASLRDAVTAHLGPPFQNHRDARRADAGIIEIEGIEVLATVAGEKMAGPGRDGLVFVPLSHARCFWRVGRGME